MAKASLGSQGLKKPFWSRGLSPLEVSDCLVRARETFHD